jgi:hypothetical protein
MYTDKSKDNFEKVGELLYDDFKNDNQQIGILYNDRDPDMKVVNTWLNMYSKMTVYYISPMEKTNTLDDKLCFCQRTNNMSFVPEYIPDINKADHIPDDELLYVKSRSGSGAKNVHILTRNEITNEPDKYNKSYVIQRNICNPDLIENKRYKMRVYFLLYNKQMYIHREFWGSMSSKIYNPDEKSKQNILDMNIIHQTPTTKWLLPTEINLHDEIFTKVVNHSSKLKEIFRPEIDCIVGNEYCILGMDYVVDKDKNPFLIEINHRSNYTHPINISNSVDIPVLFDTFKLMISGTNNDTGYILVN